MAGRLPRVRPQRPARENAELFWQNPPPGAPGRNPLAGLRSPCAPVPNPAATGRRPATCGRSGPIPGRSPSLAGRNPFAPGRNPFASNHSPFPGPGAGLGGHRSRIGRARSRAGAARPGPGASPPHSVRGSAPGRAGRSCRKAKNPRRVPSGGDSERGSPRRYATPPPAAWSRCPGGWRGARCRGPVRGPPGAGRGGRR